MYACDLRKPAVSRIHLLKRMTLELREIQALRIISILMGADKLWDSRTWLT